MNHFKAITFCYFMVDGRCGLASVYDGICVCDEDTICEDDVLRKVSADTVSCVSMRNFLRKMAVSCLADIDRLYHTRKLTGISSRDALSTLYSIQNILDSSIFVVVCDPSDSSFYRYDPVSCRDVVLDYIDEMVRSESDDVVRDAERLRSLIDFIPKDIDIVKSMEDK